MDVESPPLVATWAEAGCILAGWFVVAAFIALDLTLGDAVLPHLPGGGIWTAGAVPACAFAFMGAYWNRVCERVYGPPSGSWWQREKLRTAQRNALHIRYLRPLWGAIVFVLLRGRTGSAREPRTS